MTASDWILWLVGLLITHAVAYFMGRADAQNAGEGQILSAEAQYDLEMYKIDKFYEHERWKEVDKFYEHERWKEEKYSAPIMAYEEPLDEGADWRGDHEE